MTPQEWETLKAQYPALRWEDCDDADILAMAKTTRLDALTEMTQEARMADRLYTREQTLQAHGITVRRANHGEQTTNEYGDTLTWVVDLGSPHQALKAYATKAEALDAAERYLP